MRVQPANLTEIRGKKTTVGWPERRERASVVNDINPVTMDLRRRWAVRR